MARIPLGGYAGGAGGAPGPSGCSGYGGSGGAASVIELGTSSNPTSVATIVAGGSGGSGGSGQFSPTLGQISLPTFTARADATSTTGEDGESVYTACHQVTGEQCDGGGGAGGGGGAQGGSNGFVEFGSGTSDEWFGLGGYPGENSTGGLSGLNPQYSYYADDNANGSVVLSYSSGAPGAPVVVDGMPGDSSVALYWAAPTMPARLRCQLRRAVRNESLHVVDDGDECTGTSTSCDVTGLTNGTGYEFEVAAVNGEGQGVLSAASDVVTPTGPPGAPAITGVTPSDGSLSLAFTPASSSQPILDYEYSLDGGTTWTSTGTTCHPRSSVVSPTGRRIRWSCGLKLCGRRRRVHSGERDALGPSRCANDHEHHARRRRNVARRLVRPGLHRRFDDHWLPVRGQRRRGHDRLWLMD